MDTPDDPDKLVDLVGLDHPDRLIIRTGMTTLIGTMTQMGRMTHTDQMSKTDQTTQTSPVTQMNPTIRTDKTFWMGTKTLRGPMTNRCLTTQISLRTWAGPSKSSRTSG